MENYSEIFAQNLKRLRKEIKWTQGKLAEKLGYTEKAVSKWEGGSSIPPAETLILLASTLNVTVDDLFSNTSQPSYYLGIDGGATKTTFVLSDTSGTVLSKVTLGPSNPFDNGFESACAVLEEGIVQVSANLSKRKISVFAGISGGGIKEMRERLNGFLAKFGFFKYAVGSDAMNIISAGLGDGDGIVVIMGTGSSCFGKVNGEQFRIGGYGYLFDHAGGGYDLGNAAISASLKAEDGSGEPTLLRTLLTEELKTATVAENISHFYAIGKSGIASFAPLVFRAHEQGDPVAEEILRANMAHVVNMISTAGRRFHSEKGIKVVLVGGLTKRMHLLSPLIEGELMKRGENEKFDVSVFAGDVVVGALKLAGADFDRE